MAYNDTPAAPKLELGEKPEVAVPGSALGDPEKRPATSQSRSKRRVIGTSDTENQSVQDIAETGPGPGNVTSGAQRWCRPRGNISRLAFAFLSFFIAGMNDAAVGVCIQSDLLHSSCQHGKRTNVNRHSFLM